MQAWLDTLVVLLILTNLRLVGSSRLFACVRTVAVQGLLLGLLPVLVQWNTLTWRPALLAAGSTFLKAGVFPWLLRRAVRDVGLRREVDPVVGYSTSLLITMGLLGVTLYLGQRLPPAGLFESQLMTPVAIFTILVGLFLIVARRTAVMQVLGYLAMENGIYAFGMALAVEEPALVELGILLDVFMGVFVMGIAIFNISREFDHIDTDRLSVLKD
ncbi:MAG: NADH-quinone oxidoreductase subunit K [Myxococcota bacterium]